MAYIYDLEQQARDDFERLYENGSGHVCDVAGWKVRRTDEYYADALEVPGGAFARALDHYERARWNWINEHPFDEERYEIEGDAYEDAHNRKQIDFEDYLYETCVELLVEDLREQVRERRLQTKLWRKLWRKHWSSNA